MARFVHFYYFDKNTPYGDIIPEHVDYWKQLNMPNYQGGSFENDKGGMVIFDAGSIEEATKLVENDPFVEQGIVKSHFLEQWDIKNINV